MVLLLFFVIASSKLFPVLNGFVTEFFFFFFLLQYKGQVLTEAHVFSRLLSSLAGVLYAAAILLYDTQFGFLLKVMPWLLSALCCVTLDLLVSFYRAVSPKLTYLAQFCGQCSGDGPL